MKKYLIALCCCLAAVFSVSAQQVNERLYTAVNAGDVKTAAQLLRAKADPNASLTSGPWKSVSLLTLAVLKNNTAMAKVLLKYKADANQKDGFNTSPLMYAASQGNKELIELLLKHGADIRANDGQDNTVLTAARESNKPEIIALIEEKLKAADKKEGSAKK